MDASNRNQHLAVEKQQVFAPRLYYFNPLLAGPRAGWSRHLDRCHELGFDGVLTAPLFAPDAAADIFVTADHERISSTIAENTTADEFIGALAKSCRERDLNLFLDVVVGRVAADAPIAKSNPSWFEVAAERIDPRSSLQPRAVYARFEQSGIGVELTDWWTKRLQRLLAAGVAGFRCEDPQSVPPDLWRLMISAIKQTHSDCRMLAWTPGIDWRTIAAFCDVGFDAAFSSLPWWDGRGAWFVEEYELLRGIGSVIGCPEAPFGPRAARRSTNASDRQNTSGHLLRRAAVTGSGLMVPMGFEFGATAEMPRARPVADDPGPDSDDVRTISIAADIREANALSAELADRGASGQMRMLAEPGNAVTAILRANADDVRSASSFVVVLLNTDLAHERPLPVSLDPLPATAGTAAIVESAIAADREFHAPLAAGEVRVLEAIPLAPIKAWRAEMKAAQFAVAPRIVVDNVTPSVDRGRFAVKRVIGEEVVVEADVFTDGYELLGLELLWRPADHSEWTSEPMQPLGNDRWRAVFRPNRIGRYEYTIEAWWDRYGTFVRDLELKRNANSDIRNEITEGRNLIEIALARTKKSESKVVRSALNWLADATPDVSVEIFLNSDLREVMRENEERQFLYRFKSPFALEVERPQAAFGAWYELFPRSATRVPGRHGTFADVIGRLPAIKDMGFDVLYLTPIHPIGRTNRKGKNNTLDVGADDVGSPYAIGSNDGGHDAIHPALGTIEDFRRLRDAAMAHGMEIALDFAIQCSPDHPWLRQHPEWFNWRPDGSLRYAENPPKKYQDIVNVDFYAPKAFSELWVALRDIVLYWASEGVRIFRVDNPHTKPLPFWEWLIAQVRSRHPDVIFLSEAFTRPKMMYRLAKAGFSQSYSYFTWRNTKQELTDYFVELTTTDVKDYFRPHLFVNTPDINPYFLQTSGRPGFLIRAALAATLSGLWGIYSGFELCEAAALPGREEYLDSEKYEIRIRDNDAPGNIIAEIAKLNRIRRNHPVLHSHLGVRFYAAHNDQVLFYGKRSSGGGDMILVAVNLDPFRAQDVTIEVPLWELKLTDGDAVAVEDLMAETALIWQGKLQRIRLDPALPFAIWRISPKASG